MKHKTARLEDTDKRLFTQDDTNGEALYFLDEACTQPFEGIIYGRNQGWKANHNGWLEYEAEIRKGAKNGIEIIYREDGSIEQISQCKNNVLYGISKEFDSDGALKYVSVVFNNDHLKMVEVDAEGKYHLTRDTEVPKRTFPADIQHLLMLSKADFIAYPFSSAFGLHSGSLFYTDDKKEPHRRFSEG